MPKVTFKNDNLTVECPAGTKLVDLAEQKGAAVNFSCKEGVCLTCLVNVVSGSENLNARTENEASTLEAFGAQPNQRLACQIVVNGDCVIETVG
ncbi:Na(+)-translocating NADH-quinone reductase subunit F [uncultured archaeon]|nr:Na(+)-translocating NADH-quinone reductase subunit F [uncultured archaeon]